jgi:hypothetical protein
MRFIFDTLKHMYREVLPKNIRQTIGLMRAYPNFYLNNKAKKEEKRSYGAENPDKIFYIIAWENMNTGLAYRILNNVRHIAYALDKGYIPIIDMQNYNNQYVDDGKYGKENAWEYYFEQPTRYRLDDISESKNIIISYNSHLVPCSYKYSMFDIGMAMSDDIEKVSWFRNFYASYIKPNGVTEQYLHDQYHSFLKDKGRVLGVLCRGTDYLHKHPKGHPVQPEPMDVIKKAEQILHEQNCEYLYLATEDDNIYKLFADQFGNKLITNNQRLALCCQRDSNNAGCFSA